MRHDTARHHDHRRGPDRALCALLRWHARRHGANRRRAPRAGRPADGPVSGEATSSTSPAFPKVLAKDLVRVARASRRRSSASRFTCDQRVTALEEEDGHFVLVTATDRFPSRSIVIAAGIGAFSPRRLPQACAAPWYGRGIDDRVLDPEAVRGQARGDHRRRRLGVRLGAPAAGSRGAASRSCIAATAFARTTRPSTTVQAAVAAGRDGAVHLSRAARHRSPMDGRIIDDRAARREGEDDDARRLRRRAADARLRERHRRARRVGARRWRRTRSS